MNDFKVVTYSSKYFKIWNDFLETSKNATFLFHRDFMDYHQDRFEDASILIFKSNKVVAVFPACKEEVNIFSHKGLTYGGLVVESNMKFNALLSCFKSALKHYDKEGFQTLEIKMIPNIYNNYPSDELSYLMHVLNAKLTRRDILSVVSQGNSLKYSKDRVDGVKRANNNGLIIKEDDEFDEFWNTILIPNLNSKHGVNPVHSLEEIKLLKKCFPKNIIQFNVYHDNELVAGSTIFVSKQVAHSQYISANDTKNQTGSLDFLHDYLLKEAFKEKPYFDFGISNENNGMQVNAGLQYWKEGFGARAIAQDFYQLPIANLTSLDSVLI